MSNKNVSGKARFLKFCVAIAGIFITLYFLRFLFFIPIVFQIFAGIISTIVYAIHQGIDSTQEAAGPFATLYEACYWGDTGDAMRHMQYDTININLQTPNGNTALHAACFKDKDMIIHLLLRHPNINTDIRNDIYYAPLHTAAFEKSIKCIRAFAQYPEKVNPNAQDTKGLTPLHIACYTGDIEVVKRVLEHANIDLNVKSFHNQTPLEFLQKRLNQGLISNHKAQQIISLLQEKVLNPPKQALQQAY